jgi:DnaJ-domain-containing protein 1
MMLEELREIMEQVEQQTEDVQRRIAELIRLALEEQEWDALVGTPESQSLLTHLSKKIDEQITAGEIEDGGWDL